MAIGAMDLAVAGQRVKSLVDEIARFVFQVREVTDPRALELGIIALLSGSPSQANSEPGYRLTADAIIVDEAKHRSSWTYPRHAVEIDSLTHTVFPRRVGKRINAIEDLGRFQIKIGDEKAYENLLNVFLLSFSSRRFSCSSK